MEAETEKAMWEGTRWERGLLSLSFQWLPWC